MRRHDEDSRPPFGRGPPFPSPCDLVGFEGDSGRPGAAVVAPTPTARLPPAGARRTRVGFGPRVPPVPRPDRHHMPPLPRRGVAAGARVTCRGTGAPASRERVGRRRHTMTRHVRARSLCPFSSRGEPRMCAGGALACLPHAPVRTRSPRPHHVATRGRQPGGATHGPAPPQPIPWSSMVVGAPCSLGFPGPGGR
jgi:hypothetical protein